MSDQVWWYATRAAGLMTWSTAVAAVIVGLLLSTRTVKARTGPWMLDLHRFLGGLSVLFLAHPPGRARLLLRRLGARCRAFHVSARHLELVP